MKDKDTLIAFRLPTTVRTALAAAATEDGRTVSGMTRRIIEKWLTANGYLPKPKKDVKKRRN